MLSACDGFIIVQKNPSINALMAMLQFFRILYSILIDCVLKKRIL
ncbi:hypothetical protein ELI_0036 [Eubacterium callanderi]|uniref:Uncharacterized protein n=1 Tax=Eubacterium callanderi TaxID=53442 RepID=E3GHA3_9FIRM|nr:hypothetical protein ELI_0036 [Eubacterium callanderi]